MYVRNAELIKIGLVGVVIRDSNPRIQDRVIQDRVIQDRV